MLSMSFTSCDSDPQSVSDDSSSNTLQDIKNTESEDESMEEEAVNEGNVENVSVEGQGVEDESVKDESVKEGSPKKELAKKEIGKKKEAKIESAQAGKAKKVKAKNESVSKKTTPDLNKNEEVGMSAFFTSANEFFAKNIRNGKVNYDGISKDANQLNELSAAIANMDLAKVSEKEYKAFWINSYNILTIKGIIDNYPIKKPTDVDGFFDKNEHTAAGTKLTLNDIENNKLRKKLNDPRIHFVLVCGAQSCPPIISQAYTAGNVDELLERQTKKAVNADYFVKVDDSNKEIEASMIMKWYKEDFVKGDQDEIAFLNKYRDNKIPADYKLSHQEYNWNLNKQ